MEDRRQKLNSIHKISNHSKNPAMMKKTIFLLGTAGVLLLASCKPSVPSKIAATDTGKPGPGAQTIQGGDVTLTLAADGKPLTYTRGNGTNLLNTKDASPGFYMTTGSGPEEKTIPFTSAESKPGKLILTAEDKTRATLAVNAGQNYFSFRLEKLENVPKDSQPVLNFRLNFNNALAEFVPFDYMCLTSTRWASIRYFGTATWPYLWRRGDRDPLGGFAFFVPQGEDDHNETMLRVWTEEKMPHPKVEGEWTYERAKAWVQEWEETFADGNILTISAEKPEQLDPLLEYAKKLKVDRVYLHTDTWRGGYWVYDRDPLSVNPNVFPRGEPDLKAFIDKLRANGMDAMMHTICYGVGPEGSKYLGKGKKTDRRLANWGKGKLEKPISATDTTIFFRPDPGVKFPGPDDYPGFWKFTEVRIGDEIISCKFEDTDQPVWKLTDCVRGASAANHEAGTEVVGLLKAYGQNYYPDSMTDLPEITAKDYAEFFNRLGVQHHEYDGGECHNDVPWGYPKWTMYVYQNTERPMTSSSSSATPNPWDLVYRMYLNPGPDGKRHQNLYRPPGGSAALTLHRPGRLATGPIENHFTLGQGAAANSRSFVFWKPEPMFGITTNSTKDHGLAELIADQFATWREITPKLTPELRKQIADTYYQDLAPNTMNQPTAHRSAKIVYEARRAGGGYELQPFTIMTRGKEDADWTTVQEFAGILPRQYVAPGQRVRLDNPFGRQAPQFIIRVLSGYSDSAAPAQPSDTAQSVTKDFEGYMIGAGVDAKKVETEAKAATAPVGADPFSMQPKAAQLTNLGDYKVADVGRALEISYDNLVKATPAPAEAPAEPAPSPIPAPGETEIFRQEGFPAFAFKANPINARGVACTVTGDGSGSFLVIQVGSNKDYVVPIDFTARKDIFIPIGEVARTTGRWGMRYYTKFSNYEPVHLVSIGFGRIPANTAPKVLIENLRMVGEKPSSIKNPVIHAGSGTLAIQGEVKSDQYLWYQGGDKVGVYDLNWNHQADLPAVASNYEVDKGFSEYWIDGECANPTPWLDVQFLTKGEILKVPNTPATSAAK
jgi:hypothetical protein